MLQVNNKILIVTYAFPPVGGAGVQRTVKLVKYLHALGWETHVLTAANPSVPVKDYTLLRDVPVETKIHKAYTIEIPYFIKHLAWHFGKGGDKGIFKEGKVTRQKPKRFLLLKKILQRVFYFVKNKLFFPDPQIGWVKLATKKAKKILVIFGIENVLISAPPFSSLLIGNNIKDEMPHIKVIADFRDEWSEFYVKAYKFHDHNANSLNKILAMERNVINKADCITMATESFCQNYRRIYSRYADKIRVLTNGYDPDDFEINKKCIPLSNGKFHITYTGTVFNVTTARYFLKAVEKLIKQRPDLQQKLQINFFGRITQDELPFFKKFSYTDILKIHGYVDHNMSTLALKNSDLLIVIVDDYEGGDRIIAAKIFEYIYSGSRILGLVPPNGEVAKIIKITKTGTVINNRHVRDITKELSSILDAKTPVKIDNKKIQVYSRLSVAKQLIAYFDELSSK